MLIKVKDLIKNYHTGEVVTKVLYGLSFEIDHGEFVAIMGPSGSGKSTLMHILSFLDRPTSGEYLFHDKNISHLEDDDLAALRNREVGFVFQAFNLLPRTTVLENVKLPLLYSENKKGIDERSIEVLKSVGLEHRLNYYTNQISGGEKQRVAIARALVNKPSVLFADEPTGNLDSKSGVQIMEILQKLNDAGNTIVMVTHETYTSEHAKRIIRIHDGHIISDQPVLNRRRAGDGDTLK